MHTYYRWRKEEYGGLRVDQAKYLKELETENSPRLKRLVADASLWTTRSEGSNPGKLLSPDSRRRAVEHVRRVFPGLSAPGKAGRGVVSLECAVSSKPGR